jgi:hypothetical protein
MGSASFGDRLELQLDVQRVKIIVHAVGSEAATDINWR